MGSRTEEEFSDLMKIEDVTEDPLEMFRRWHQEWRQHNPRMPDTFCLATTSKDCLVSARNVVLREFDDDGFVIVTDKRSKKVDHFKNVPRAAMCFLWYHVDEQGELVTKQVRIEGTMRELTRERFQHLYDREPLHCKLRAALCHQGREVEWNGLKRRHDELLDAVRRKENDLPMPDHFIGYKLFPTMMDFYCATERTIGDRVLYRKDSTSDAWKWQRIYV